MTESRASLQAVERELKASQLHCELLKEQVGALASAAMEAQQGREGLGVQLEEARQQLALCRQELAAAEEEGGHWREKYEAKRLAIQVGSLPL
jgi:chromosome segregation ATPase